MVLKKLIKYLCYPLKNLDFLLLIPPFKFTWRLIHYIKVFGFKNGIDYIKKELCGSKELVEYIYKDKPIFIRLNSSDIYVLMNIIIYGEYILKLKKVPRFIVDAGAYTGISTVYLADKYPDAKIIAVEPDKENYNLLIMNTSGIANIKCINNALWSSSGIVTMSDRKVGQWGYTMSDFNKSRNGKRSQIESVDIPWIMDKFSINYIDFLKVDIEGSEKEVLENSGKWIDKVGVIAVELHDRINSGCKSAFYKATANFEHRIKKGENVFKLREGYFFN